MLIIQEKRNSFHNFHNFDDNFKNKNRINVVHYPTEPTLLPRDATNIIFIQLIQCPHYKT